MRFTKKVMQLPTGAIIDAAKEKIFAHGKSVNQVAYESGFKYPHHFSIFFRQHVGYSPNVYLQIWE
jgi:transcriptional regulator GlxA family with amidase domain